VETDDDTLARQNIDLAANLLSDGEWLPLKDDKGLERGLIRSEPVSLQHLATTLDALRYSHHDPDLGNELSQRWEHYARLLGMTCPPLDPSI